MARPSPATDSTANLPKPCFHPLHTAAGRQIAGFQMSDHTWHRGLWFTIKFINKTNFWEEQPAVRHPANAIPAANANLFPHRP